MDGSPGTGAGNDPESSLRYIDLLYDHDKSEETVLNLVYQVQPDWQQHVGQLEITKFTDGITNTLLKVSRNEPGASQADKDRQSVLMRAYGNNTDLIIDRDREAKSHALLAQQGMAPPLLARFQNGLLYRFIPGLVSTPDDLASEPVWRGVARKLGEWHARIPISVFATDSDQRPNGGTSKSRSEPPHTDRVIGRPRSYSIVLTRSPQPNLWSVLQRWVDALEETTEKEQARKVLLQNEIERSFRDLDNRDGIGEHGLIFGHCDLLSANVIMLQRPDAASTSTPTSTSSSPSSPSSSSSPTATSASVLPVTFIDYEYATPCPAAFDIANHFAEWGGYDLDYNRLPTRAVRRAFLSEYISSYNRFARAPVNAEAAVNALYDEIDNYRGMPGLYWGIWALIQARISQIDFDYAQYAEDRLSEYWAWRAARENSRPPEGKAIPVRERRWNQEC